MAISAAPAQQQPTGTTPEHLDVLIVGAGMSGIGFAYHLQQAHPGRSYAILESREAIGGTWDLFRYPGIRSDSDLHTYGFAFKPWTDEKSIADGPSILRYIDETASENGIDRHIRFAQKVVGARWSSAEGRWTVEVERVHTGERVELTCSWLFSAAGYYRYDRGHDPGFEGTERFQGEIVHPQFWPEDLDYAGKRVLVIGSGATAVTLVPAMTDEAAHVTMLQRTPSYVVSLPEKDPIANALKRRLPAKTAYELTRRKNIWLQRNVYRLSRSRPQLVKRLLRRGLERHLPAGYDIDTHFTPPYDPWDQRLCSVPDADLFQAISAGRASVVTDRIATFTEKGLLLESGRELEADVIVTATGLELQAFGGIDLVVDGEPVALHERLAYKGTMLSGVPNFAYAIGYTNSSWTLKVDLVGDYLCRLMAFMDARGLDVCVPVNDDPSMPTRPLLDFGAGYVRRAAPHLPQQGTRGPWTVSMSYRDDLRRLRDGEIDDGVARFSRSPARGRVPAAA
jgi:cation diffusion facilitator CzcD-associated flavoprotein CzcO